MHSILRNLDLDKHLLKRIENYEENRLDYCSSNCCVSALVV